MFCRELLLKRVSRTVEVLINLLKSLCPLTGLGKKLFGACPPSILQVSSKEFPASMGLKMAERGCLANNGLLRGGFIPGIFDTSDLLKDRSPPGATLPEGTFGAGHGLQGIKKQLRPVLLLRAPLFRGRTIIVTNRPLYAACPTMSAWHIIRPKAGH